MNILLIVNIFLIAILLITVIETIVKIKNSEGKLIESIRKSLILRIDIIMILTIAISVITIINILFNK